MIDTITRKTTISAGEEQADSSQTLQYLIYFLFGIIEVLLVFRTVFKMTGANPASGFVSFINSLTQIFIMPFVGIFRQATTPGVEVTAVLEPATLVAMVVYAVLAWGIVQLVEIVSGRLQ